LGILKIAVRISAVICSAGDVALDSISMNLCQKKGAAKIFPLGELEETTGTPSYYVDEVCPAGS